MLFQKEVLKVVVSGNVDVVSVHFRDTENEEYLDQEPYDFVDAKKPIKIEPVEDALYVEITLQKPILNEDGSRPQYYKVNLEIYGCFEPSKCRLVSEKAEIILFNNHNSENMNAKTESLRYLLVGK